jgi:hypothetical protein
MPYIGKSPGNGVRQRYIYAATAGQTSFSGNDSAGISLVYDDPSYLDVYQNGVLLKPVTDYASTTGTSVVLVTGATTDDVVEMITYDTFAIADTVSAKDGGAFAGAVSMASTLGVTGAVTTSSTASIAGHASVGVNAVDSTRALTVAGASDGSGSSILVCFNSSLAAKFAVRDDGLVTAGSNLSLDGNGVMTLPSQPCFQVNNSSAQNNIPINTGTTIVFDQEIIDKGANFASNTFTAPVTGSYFLGLKINLQTVDSAADYYRLRLATANRNYDFFIDPDFGQDPSLWTLSITMVADMDASDTAQGNFYQAGGTAQTDLRAAESQFFGHLIA